jgi:hypothetical protein
VERSSIIERCSVVESRPIVERGPVAHLCASRSHRDRGRAEDRDRGERDDRFSDHVLAPWIQALLFNAIHVALLAGNDRTDGCSCGTLKFNNQSVPLTFVSAIAGLPELGTIQSRRISPLIGRYDHGTRELGFSYPARTQCSDRKAAASSN